MGFFGVLILWCLSAGILLWGATHEDDGSWKRWSCPFGQRKYRTFTFGVDPGFVDYVTEREDRSYSEFVKKYPGCWDRFLNWLGVK